MSKILKKLIFISICLVFFIPFFSVNAQELYFEGSALNEDLTIENENHNVKIVIPAEAFKNNIAVYLNENQNVALPLNLGKLSNIYNLNIISQNVSRQPIKISMVYQNGPDEYTAKAIYQWKNANQWQKLNSLNNSDNQTITAELTGNSFTLGVFETKAAVLNFANDSYISPDGDLSIITPIEWQNDFSIIYKGLDNLDYPETLTRISPIYEYDIKKTKDLPNKAITLKIKYHDDQGYNDQAKELYYWDNNHQKWLIMASVNDFTEQILSAQTNFSYLRFAVFIRTDIQEGKASWYRYKNCNCAASRDYPKGTKLKITNINLGHKNYGKSVIVKINDFGPELWTKRLIDLDSKVYQQLANLKSGIMNVRIEKIND